MPTNITESDAHTTTVAVPDDGEAADSDSLLDNFAQGLANRTNFANKRLRAEGSTDTRTTASDTATYSDFVIPAASLLGASNAFKRIAEAAGNRTKWIKERCVGANTTAMPKYFNMIDAYQGGGWTLTQPISGAIPRYVLTGGTAPIIVPLHHMVPRYGTIVAAYAYFEGGTGHSGLPGTMPRIELGYMSLGAQIAQATFDNAPTAISTFTDGSADVTAYEKVRVMGGTLSHAITGEYHYFLRIYPESGANSLAGMTVMGGEIHVTE